jgi:hypothetical protein
VHKNSDWAWAKAIAVFILPVASPLRDEKLACSIFRVFRITLDLNGLSSELSQP